MRELNVSEINEVNGGEWEDITCTVGTTSASCTGSLGMWLMV